jgi:hypothetical protein
MFPVWYNDEVEPLSYERWKNRAATVSSKFSKILIP